MLFGSAIISIVFSFGLTVVMGSIHETLPYFETLHHNVLRHDITRRDTTSHPHSRVVQFTTHNRRFELVLQRDHSVISDNFIAFAVDQQDNKRRVDVEHEFYRGFEASEPDDSFVRAYWENGELVSASIRLANDTWILEPSIHHLPYSENYTMIAYRNSDLKLSVGDRILQHFPPELRAADHDAGSSHPSSKRSKRSRSDGPCTTNNRKSCSLLLVADHRFHRILGYQKVMSTINYLINQITQINDLFQQHSFGSCGSGYGFHIKQIIVLTEPSTNKDFNNDDDGWDTEAFLKSFQSVYSGSLKEYCVGHLFTGLPFSNNVGGLAYTRGICSNRGINVGWTSYQRKTIVSFETKARTILTQEAMPTTAHEFGHNWGSVHDPDTAECNPSGSYGGKYLMYTYSVSGLDSNNKLFSPCSIKAIGKTLMQVSSNCFSEQTQDKCGNFKLDDGEDCDEGPEVSQNVLHRCCNSKTCKFLPGAVCSDVHHECCESCVIANTSKICLTEMACHNETFCDGISKHCPEKKTFKSFGTRCNADLGFCMDGKCESVCKYHNLSSCVCDSVHDSCRWCCKDPAIPNSTCTAFFSTDHSWNSNKVLPDGTACVQGYCRQGECIKQEDNLSLRMWKVILDIASGPFAKFMSDNIVGSVIIFSLIIWIPLGCLFSNIEKIKTERFSKHQEEEAQWLAPSNDEVISKHDQHRWTIIKSKRVRRSLRHPRFIKTEEQLVDNRQSDKMDVE